MTIKEFNKEYVNQVHREYDKFLRKYDRFLKPQQHAAWAKRTEAREKKYHRVLKELAANWSAYEYCNFLNRDPDRMPLPYPIRGATGDIYNKS